MYFTVRSGVVQFRLIPEMFRTLTDKTPRDDDGKPQSVSAFQAFTISAASRVGVGNIAGVGTAIAIGGPGAVFWMWVMAFIGGASSFVESTLGQLSRSETRTASAAGPPITCSDGLKARWMGVVFADHPHPLLPASRSARCRPTRSRHRDLERRGRHAVAGRLGHRPRHRRAHRARRLRRRAAHRLRHPGLVPIMALGYLLLGLVIVGMNIESCTDGVRVDLHAASGFNEVVGATFGYIVMTGVKRGMFSNEAGLGSAPNAGASAAVTHPVKQGLVQTLGVYFDTFLVCSITAFIILVSDARSRRRGTRNRAHSGRPGRHARPWSNMLLSVIIFLLAFSSILGNYYYGESNIEFITTQPVSAHRLPGPGRRRRARRLGRIAPTSSGTSQTASWG